MGFCNCFFAENEKSAGIYWLPNPVEALRPVFEPFGAFARYGVFSCLLIQLSVSVSIHLYSVHNFHSL